MAQRIPVEVLDNDSLELQRVARMGRPARIQSQVATNRVAAITRLTMSAAEGIAHVYGSTAEVAEAGIQRLDRQDTAQARLGESAAQEHQIAKENLNRRLHQIAEMTAGALTELYQRNLEEVCCQPDSAFYQVTLRDELSTWFWDDTSIELQRRQLAPLTPGERVREFFIGGVINAKAAASDQRQIAERRDRLALCKQLDLAHAQLAELAARNADLELLAGETATLPDDGYDDEVIAQMDAIDELMRQMRAPQRDAQPLLQRRAHANGRLEVVDAESID